VRTVNKREGDRRWNTERVRHGKRTQRRSVQQWLEYQVITRDSSSVSVSEGSVVLENMFVGNRRPNDYQGQGNLVRRGGCLRNSGAHKSGRWRWSEEDERGLTTIEATHGRSRR
jgi:hypothetical protein